MCLDLSNSAKGAPAGIAIAAETRHALTCAPCRRRKETLSPTSIEGKHDSLAGSPEIIVEVVYRVRTDAGRLSKRWFRGVIAAGLSKEQYVETVSPLPTPSRSTQ